MALMPKRVKHRKSQRRRIKGDAHRGNTVVFGEWGLQSLEAGHVTAQTIEACRIAATQYIRGVGSCTFGCFHTSLLLLDRLRQEWVREKANPIVGLPLLSLGQ